MPLVVPPELKPHSFLTIEEAAALLNVRVRWMREAVAERRLGHYKIGPLGRSPVADRFDLVAGGRVEPHSHKRSGRRVELVPTAGAQ
ncbi:MAG TPA: helix-turn-helix domain-containing protein [Acidimicrobiales bacterium]|nr:helix-turn-helix domain-containing protein [Acidimicrobiales bacterium]